MSPTRRTVVGALVGSLTAGCLTTPGGDDTPSPTPDTTATATPRAETVTETPTPTPDEPATPSAGGCDPDEVTRPPILEGLNHSPMGYGTKPQELTRQSVADYLADFETAYAWNRILETHSPVTNLGVDTTTPWTPEPAGEGFLASSRIETSYAREADETTTTRTYVASYYVSAGPVYRAEGDDTVDPRTDPDRQLVQCGEDGGK